MSFDPRNLARLPDRNINRPDRAEKYTQKFTDEKFQRCAMAYRRIPWLSNNVESVLVKPVNLPSIYYDENKSFSIDEDRYFQVTSKYYVMRCYGKNQSINDKTNIISLNYKNNRLSFKVAYVVIIDGEMKIFSQNHDMFRDEEEELRKLASIEVNKAELINSLVSDNLRHIAQNALEDFVPTKEYSKHILKNIEETTNNSYEYIRKVSKIYVSAKSGSLFSKRLLKGYYNEDIIHLLDYDTLLEGIEYNVDNINEYVDDIAMNLLLYSTKFTDIPTRKYMRENKKPIKLNKYDIRLKCKNLDSIKNVPDENLAFYTVNKQFFCYDISRLYIEFFNGNTINPDTGKEFSPDFVNKIKTLYKFKINNIPVVQRSEEDDEDYDEIVRQLSERPISEDKDYQEILAKVRDEIQSLNFYEERCVKCNKEVGTTGIATINKKGEKVACCSKACFDRY